MTNHQQTSNNVFKDIGESFLALPMWVKVWALLILTPINLVSLFFLNEPLGKWVAFLAIVAMVPNLPLMLRDRGFSTVMGIPHVIPWTILVIFLLFFRPEGSAAYNVYLWILLITDGISLPFDYTDSVKWFRGKRSVVR